MTILSLFVTGFERPDLLREQRRLLDKYLADDFEVCVLDNSRTAETRRAMEVTCDDIGFGYRAVSSEKHEHPDALNLAASIAADLHVAYWGCLDHDVFPRRPTTLIDLIDKAGFYGIGQRHTPTQKQYLWPGFVFFSRDWLNGRVPNFNGIRGADKRDDGDCGSMLHTLFTDDDWTRVHRPEHGYGHIRPSDTYGLQSFGYEFFGDWIHLTNASRWMEVPNPNERDMLLRDMLAAL